MPNQSDMWFVTYKVPGMTGDTVHRRGPYSKEEVESHRRDIAGYEGVTDVKVESTSSDLFVVQGRREVS